MLLRLFLLFTLVPIAELALLIEIGGLIGLGPTVALVIATGATGAWLARREGLKSWLAVQRDLASGKVPGEELGHGVMILIAGVVLLTPGVITDVMGIALLLRPVRKALIKSMRARFERQIAAGTVSFVSGAGPGVFWTSTGGTPGSPFEAPTEPEVDGWTRPASADRSTSHDGTPSRPRRATGYPGGREIIVDDSTD